MRKVQGKIKNAKLNSKMRRKLSIRKKIVGSSERPRICVNKTNKHLFVQVVNDVTSTTFFSVQTFGKKKVGDGANTKSATLVGEKIAAELKGIDCNCAVFDRAGAKYTGLINLLANTIRENGISI